MSGKWGDIEILHACVSYMPVSILFICLIRESIYLFYSQIMNLIEIWTIFMASRTLCNIFMYRIIG